MSDYVDDDLDEGDRQNLDEALGRGKSDVAHTWAHTPGPWVKTYNDYDEHYNIVIQGSEGTSVRRIAMVVDSGKDGPMNARLISAAPDLFEALIDLVKYLKYIEPNSISELELAEKAIKKARGE